MLSYQCMGERGGISGGWWEGQLGPAGPIVQFSFGLGATSCGLGWDGISPSPASWEYFSTGSLAQFTQGHRLPKLC